MKENSRKLIHDLKCERGIIGTTITLLDSKPTELKQKLFQQMLTRHLASAESMVTDLASSKQPEDAFDSGLLIELNSLLRYLQTERLASTPSQNQEQMDSLIQALLSLGLSSN